MICPTNKERGTVDESRGCSVDNRGLAKPGGDSVKKQPAELEAEAVKKTFPRLVLVRTGEEFSQLECGDSKKVDRSWYTYVCVSGTQHYYQSAKKDGDKEKDAAKDRVAEQGKKIVRGYRGKLIIEESDGSWVEYHSIERANTFTHIGDRSGQSKIYTITMRPRAHQLGKQELIIEGAVFIHAAPYPSWLEGCVAPGMKVTRSGVSESPEALSNIISGLGGWDPEKTFQLEVVGYKTTAGIYKR